MFRLVLYKKVYSFLSPSWCRLLFTCKYCVFFGNTKSMFLGYSCFFFFFFFTDTATSCRFKLEFWTELMKYNCSSPGIACRSSHHSENLLSDSKPYHQVRHWIFLDYCFCLLQWREAIPSFEAVGMTDPPSHLLLHCCACPPVASPEFQPSFLLGVWMQWLCADGWVPNCGDVFLCEGLVLWTQLLCSSNKATQADYKWDSKVSWWPYGKCWNRIVQVLFYCWSVARGSDVDVTVLMHLVASGSSAVICVTLCTSCICLNLPSTLFVKGMQSLKSCEGAS